jgi:hypothetical protein
MAVDVVARIREEHFGPDVDPRLAELERELAAAREQLERDRADLDALVAEYSRTASERLDKLAAKVAALSKPRG